MNVGMGMLCPAGIGTASSASMNAATASAAWFFQSETTDPIVALAIRRTSGPGVVPTYRISLQGVDASGNPDGTIKASGNASNTFAGGTTTLNQVTWLTLTSSYALGLGEKLCIVLEYSSGTIDGSNNMLVVGTCTSGTGGPTKYPNAATGASGVYTRSAGTPFYGYRTATKTYGTPINGALTQNINSGATAEAGAKFSVFSGASGTYTIKRARFCFATTVAAKTLTCTLYQGGGAGDTTALASVDLDTDSIVNPSTAMLDFVFDDSPLPALNFGDTYRVAVSTPDASNETMVGFIVTSASDMQGLAWGQNFTLSTRAGGNWTDTGTSRLFCEVILGDITFASGGASNVAYW
ncbi:unnamed protein product [Gemmata massiliana]|uniref:Uncharacterized protein n=2 Tax=Gemmata massiliana TaxID=1210884 RepID=A0A6P2D9F9_9BACT|nr:unnamed protein product [Gemmata massiliana]